MSIAGITYDPSGHEARWNVVEARGFSGLEREGAQGLAYAVIAFPDEDSGDHVTIALCYDRADAERIAHDHNVHVKRHGDCDDGIG